MSINDTTIIHDDDALTEEELKLLESGDEDDFLDEDTGGDGTEDDAGSADVAVSDDEGDEAGGSPEDAPAAAGDDPVASDTPKAKPQTDKPDVEAALIGELREMREERKALRAEIAALKEPKKEPEAPQTIPDPLTDPEGWQKYNDDRFASVDQRQQEIIEQQAQAQFVQTVQSDVQRAKAEGPEYDAAYEFAITSRRNELRALHPNATDEQIRQVIAQDELALAQTAMQSGQRPSSLLVEWAKSRGYQSAPAAASKPEGAKRRNKSLGSVSGGKAGVGVTAEQAAEMDDDDFEKLPDAVKAKLLGAG